MLAPAGSPKRRPDVSLLDTQMGMYAKQHYALESCNPPQWRHEFNDSHVLGLLLPCPPPIIMEKRSLSEKSCLTLPYRADCGRVQEADREERQAVKHQDIG